MKSITTTLLLVISLIFILSNCQENNIDWSKLRSFRIYDYRTYPPDKELDSFSEDDFQQMQYVEAKLSFAKKIFQEAKLGSNKPYLWKGTTLALATFTNGEKRRIQISTYGGFFMDMLTKQCYEFDGPAKKKWDQFMSRNYQRLQQLK